MILSLSSIQIYPQKLTYSNFERKTTHFVLISVENNLNLCFERLFSFFFPQIFMSYRMGIWLRAQYVESSLVLLGLVTLALSLGNLSSRGQVCNVDRLLVFIL